MNMDEKDTYMRRIYKGLDGEIKGLQLKDKKISMNEVKVDSLNICAKYFKLRETPHQMESLIIKVNRDSVEKEFKLEKAELR